MVPELSQVLLTDENWIQRLDFRIQPAKFGVEWACGQGALTSYLLDKWDCLLGIELDNSFCQTLVNKFKNSCFHLVRADILNYPLPEKDSPYPLVSNLPYHITGPLLIKILRNSPKLKSFQGLVQKEVAERITAEPDDKKYGSISLLFDLCGEVCSIYQVPAVAFSPAPAVDSCWIEFIPGSIDFNFESYRRLARLCFRYPRKTLLNNLAEPGEVKECWKQWLNKKEISNNIRPNNLTPQLFREVHEKWKEMS